MLFLSIVHHYFLWHYSRAFKEIFHVWLNFLWFITHFFSIPQLLRTWFAPWKRITEERGDKWSFEDLAGFVIIGLITRIIGFIIRSAVIVVGLFCLTLTIIGGFITYIFWIGAPIIIITMLGLGASLLMA